MIEFQLQSCFLRPWKTGDERSLTMNANNRKIWINVRDHFPHPYTLIDAERWIFHASTNLTDTVFAIIPMGKPPALLGD